MGAVEDWFNCGFRSRDRQGAVASVNHEAHPLPYGRGSDFPG